MDDIFETVDGSDLALTALVGATLDNDLVVLADRNRSDLHWRVRIRGTSVRKMGAAVVSYVVLLSEFCSRRQYSCSRAIAHCEKILTLGKRCAHDNPANAGWGREVSLAALSPAGAEVGVDLRHFGGGVDEVYCRMKSKDVVAGRSSNSRWASKFVWKAQNGKSDRALAWREKVQERPDAGTAVD